MEGELILFPDYLELQKEVEKLRTELSMLVLEQDELQYVICRNIETEYMLKLGGLEYRVFKAQCEALRLRRKMEMIQAAMNRQERVDLGQIESRLDLEFVEYQRRLDEQISRMNDALERRQMRKLTEDQTMELKKLYRAVVKVLHPDLNPNISDEEERIFSKAVDAYQNGDLETMRIIHEMITNHQIRGFDVGAMKQLEKEKERLREHIRQVQERILRIKSQYPYTMLELLKDEQKIEAKKAELNVLLSRYEEMGEAYQVRIRRMSGE